MATLTNTHTQTSSTSGGEDAGIQPQQYSETEVSNDASSMFDPMLAQQHGSAFGMSAFWFFTPTLANIFSSRVEQLTT